jgi:alkylation response protein AidB-like acyl-CoA dehydrogenase
MMFELSDDQYDFAEVVDRALTNVDSVRVARSVLDGDADAAAAMLGLIGELGIPGLTVSTEYGGAGLPLQESMLVLEVLGRHLVPDFVAEGLSVVAPVISRHAPPELAQQVLPLMATGALKVGIQDGWSGWVPWADQLDMVAVVTADGVYLSEPRPQQVTSLVGIDATRRIGRVAPEATIKAKLDSEAARRMRGLATVSTAARLSGVADAMLRRAAGYAAQRTQFGAPIGAFQGVKHLLADAYAEVEASRRTAWWAALCLEAGTPETEEAVPLAKATIGDSARTASHAALQVHGGIGYTWECDLHLWMKRCQALEAAWGNTSDQWLELSDVYSRTPLSTSIAKTMA